jgi:hypothetical protein
MQDLQQARTLVAHNINFDVSSSLRSITQHCDSTSQHCDSTTQHCDSITATGASAGL